MRDISETAHCGKDHFKCDGGKCILTKWVCDGQEDCPRGDDEFCGESMDTSV